MDFYATITAIAAGIIQGITELLPISSSGHLLLFSELTSTNLSTLSIAVLHLGTLGALLIVMKDSLPSALKYPLNRNILIGIIPAGIIGFLFADLIEAQLGGTAIILFSLILWGGVLIFTDRYASGAKFSTTSLVKITPKQSLVVGVAQILAFIPGTSRSGITTIAGVFSGIDRTTALSFSFLIGIPLLGLSGLYSALKLALDTSGSGLHVSGIILATIVSFAFGLAAAAIFKKFIEKNILTICGIYRIILGILLLTILLTS